MTSSEEVLKRVKEAKKNHHKELDLSGLGITAGELPEYLFHLAPLQHLNLEHNQLSSLPKSFGNTSLQYLDLKHNQLGSLPKSFGNLSGLQSLTLWNNQLSSLPESFGKLTGLQDLYLQNNQLRSLPESIISLPSLQPLRQYLRGNQLKVPPQELANLGIEHVKSYFEAAKEGTVTLKEAKIIFVGNGRVGKTSIAKRLRLGIYNKDEDPTHGVRIIPWQLKLPKENNTGQKETISLNIWDFGGQDIYHATHRFFMTYRALYVLVWDCKTEEKVEQEPDKFMPYPYWLDKIRALSSKSPILMVQNKIDREQRGVDDQNHLIEKYNVQEFINVSAEDNTHISSLKAKIRRQLASHPSLSRMIGIEFPKPWQEIRTKLKQLNDEFGEHELNKSDYTRLCTEEGIDEKSSEVLLEYMHVTGDVFFIPNLNVSRIRSLLIPSGHWIVFMNCLMMKLQHQIKIIRVNSLSAVFTKSWSDSAKINALIFWNF